MVKFKENEWAEIATSAEKQLNVLKSSSKKTIKDGTQAVRGIVGDNVKETNNHMRMMHHIGYTLKKTEEKT